ncbi:DoxX family protein [Nocardia fluminea]|uniref:Putative oxidoreductase n=1 Tax=Nocardia fluminea TaxID=134984 RepID=A0A2N3WVZ9_9NOCA|nr:DoxX family protein [Nocardia fluminea]PKV98046.1 putative oxidoreductase [Nocardia fluminea]
MTTTSTTATSAGLLVLRLGVGATMAAHGTQKLFGWFDGGGLDGTERFFAASGYPSAKAFAVLAGVSETLGGIGLILGLITPLAAAAILGTMLNAIAVKWGGFFSPKGVEYETILAVAAASLALTGAGGFAVDRFVPGLRDYKIGYGLAAIALAFVAAGITLLIRN